MDGWMDGWVGGRKEPKAGLRIAYSNQKWYGPEWLVANIPNIPLGLFFKLTMHFKYCSLVE